MFYNLFAKFFLNISATLYSKSAVVKLEKTNELSFELDDCFQKTLSILLCLYKHVRLLHCEDEFLPKSKSL